MNFICESAALKAATAFACPIAKGNSIPILGCALLTAEDGHVTIACTDMDMLLTADAVAHVSKKGVACFPAEPLRVFSASAKVGSQIEVTLDDKHVICRSGRASCKIAVFDPHDFPRVSIDGHSTRSVSLPADDFRASLVTPLFAAEPEKSARYYLAGIFLESPDRSKVAHAVATNGHILASLPLHLKSDSAERPSVIIPSYAVKVIEKLAEDADEISLDIGDTKLRASSGGRSVVSKLIDGTFPDWRRVVPQRIDNPTIVAREDLAEAVGRAIALLREEKSRILKLTHEGNALQISGHSTESATEDAIDASGGVPFEIGFNGLYLRQILAAIPGEEIELHMHDPVAPAIICKRGETDALFVIMPCRV